MEALNLFELGLLQNLHDSVQCGFLDWLTRVISFTGDGGICLIVLAVGLLLFRKTRIYGAVMLTALTLDALLVNVCLKPLFARVRPYDLGIALNLIASHPSDYSFPSGHTAAAFAVATALGAAGKGWWRAGLIYGALMAFSRMYLLMHYPTDVLAGAVCGALCGAGALWIWRKTAGDVLHQPTKTDMR